MCTTLFSTGYAQFDRNWKVYLIPFSHTDVGYTSSVEDAIKTHEANLDTALSFINRTKNDSAGEQFKWTVEITWALKQYLEDRSSAIIDSLMNNVKEGNIEIGAMHFSLQSDLCGNEELIRAIYFAQELRNKYGIKINTAMIDDTPGFTWALAQILSKSNIPYFSVAMNSALSNFYSTTNLPYLFYWQAENGNKTLVWRCIDNQWAYLEGYISDHIYSGYTSMASAITSLLQSLQKSGYPYDAIYINCATGDNGKANFAIVNNVKSWNQNHNDAKLIIATPSEFFNYVSKKYSAQIPVFKGDAPNWWTWFFGPSSASGFSISRETQNLLPEAEKFSSFAGILNTGYSYPTGEIQNAYVNNLLFEDHNLGSLNASGNESFWTDKMGWVTSAYDTANQVINSSTNAIGKEINTGQFYSAAVYNSLAWQRSEFVSIPLDKISKYVPGGFKVVDASNNQEVKSQLLSDSTFVFQADSVPSLGYKFFYFVPDTGKVFTVKKFNGNILENKYYKVTVDESKGGILGIYDKTLNKEITKNDGAFNQYALNSFSFPNNLQVIESDSGSVLERLVLKGNASGTNWYKTEIILPGNYKQIIFLNSLNRPPVTSLQSIGYQFNFGVNSPELHYEIPFGNVKIYNNELSGFKTDNYAAQKWVDVTSGDKTFNANLSIEDASVIANSSGSFTGSLRMLITYNDNNTAYRAGSGLMKMNYALNTYSGEFNPDSSTFSSYNFNNPLKYEILQPNQKGALPGNTFSLLKIENPGLILSTFKKAEDGNGYIIRLYNPADKPENGKLIFGEKIFSAYETTPLENNISAMASGDSTLAVRLNPYDIKTYRLLFNNLSYVKSTAAPVNYELSQNYPNPFNPSTKINYQISQPGKVKLIVYDILGRVVKVLVNKYQKQGKYEIHFYGSALASGVYFYRLSTGSFVSTKKMILLK